MASPGSTYDSGLDALARGSGQGPETDGGARDEYYDDVSFGRTSIGDRASAAPDYDREKMRRDYEYCIALMQSRIASLERDVKDGDARALQLEQSDQRIKQLEDDLDKFRRVSLIMTSARS